MADLLERIMARYPLVGQRYFELEAICLAEKAAGLKEGDSLLKSEDDILPALAQAVRESNVDLADMARECGFEPIELRRKLALGRANELLKPGEISGLSDEELASRLQQTAEEYSLETRGLSDEILCSSVTTSGTSAASPVRHRAVKVLWLLRCRMCRLFWLQPYRIDFTPYLRGEYRFPREPKYACNRCLPKYLSDQRVKGIMRHPESEILKPPAVRAWFAGFAFAAIAILFVSGLHLHGRGPTREAAEMPAPHAIAAPAHLATKIVPGSDSELARSEAGQSNPPVTALVPTPVASVSTAVAPSPMAAGSRASGILTRKQREISALSFVGLPVATRREKSHRQRGDQSGRVSDRAIALNNCRQILRKERPLTRYSIRDTVQDADQEAVPALFVTRLVRSHRHAISARSTVGLAHGLRQRGQDLVLAFQEAVTLLKAGCLLSQAYRLQLDVPLPYSRIAPICVRVNPPFFSILFPMRGHKPRRTATTYKRPSFQLPPALVLDE